LDQYGGPLQDAIDAQTAALLAAIDGLKTIADAVTMSQPYLTGTAKVGAMLTVVTAVVYPDDATMTYNWYADGVLVYTAVDDPTYVVQFADGGKDLNCAVTASVPLFASTTRVTNTFAIQDPIKVQKAELSPASAAVGAVLTLDLEYTPADADAAVEWFRDGVLIAGASGLTYQLVESDSGRTITAKVTLSKTDYDPVEVFSTPTLVSGPVAPMIESIMLAPAGSVEVGSAVDLTYVVDPAGAIAFIEWYSGDTLLWSGGQPFEGDHYVATAADLGKSLSVKLTIIVPGFAPVVAYSNTVVVVDPVPVTPGEGV